MFRKTLHPGAEDAGGVHPQLPEFGYDGGGNPDRVAGVGAGGHYQALGYAAWAMEERVVPLEEATAG